MKLTFKDPTITGVVVMVEGHKNPYLRLVGDSMHGNVLWVEIKEEGMMNIAPELKPQLDEALFSAKEKDHK